MPTSGSKPVTAAAAKGPPSATSPPGWPGRRHGSPGGTARARWNWDETGISAFSHRRDLHRRPGAPRAPQPDHPLRRPPAARRRPKQLAARAAGGARGAPRAAAVPGGPVTVASTAPGPLPERWTSPRVGSGRVGGSVVAANDEGFAARENLIRPEAALFTPHTFGPKGQVMDGWETRRRREPGHDWAIVRLGLPGVVRALVVDTAFFTGKYPRGVPGRRRGRGPPRLGRARGRRVAPAGAPLSGRG